MLNRRCSIIVFLAVVALSVTSLSAEVSAEIDSYGEYVRTMVFTNASIKNVRIWSVQREAKSLVPLNPDGDRTTDLYPEIAEDPNHGNRPWVVWSRFNGADYDLVWARWLPGGWSPVEWMSGEPTAGDDLDPSLALDLDDGSRPYAAWWRDEGGVGRVYAGVYLNSRWSSAIAISEAGVDSRYPTIVFNDDGSFTVEFQTPDGLETRTFQLADGVSINDDVDPWDNMISLAEEPDSGMSL